MSHDITESGETLCAYGVVVTCGLPGASLPLPAPGCSSGFLMKGGMAVRE